MLRTVDSLKPLPYLKSISINIRIYNKIFAELCQAYIDKTLSI